MKINLIAQNEFIENLFICQNDNEEKQGLYSFLKEDLTDYHLICDFKDNNDYAKAVENNPIWEHFLDKFDTIEYAESIDTDIENDHFYDKLGEQNLFLTNKSSETCAKLSKERGYIFLTDSNIESVWGKFNHLKKGHLLKVTSSDIIPDESRLDSWSKLDNYCSPLTSILIFDRYILSDSTNQKMVDNLFPLLENLLKRNRNIKPLSVTIITELKNKCIIDKHTEIIHHLKTKGITNLTLNIVKHSKAFYPRGFEGLHSRYIFTNYYHIKSDDSFNFFKENKKINNDADVRINFSLSSRIHCFYEKELIDIKKYLNKLKNNSSNPKPEYQTLYYPDKSNYLLN